MNELLTEVSERYNQELDQVSKFLEVLPLIPPSCTTTTTAAATTIVAATTTASTPSLTHEEREQEYLSSLDHGEGSHDKIFAHKLRKLFRLERQAKEQHEHGRTQLNDKTKLLLAMALVDVATLLANDEGNVRTKWESKRGDHDISSSSSCQEEDESSTMIKVVQTVKDYLLEVKSIGCRNLSISERDNARHCSDLFKMMEKCGRMEVEIEKLEQDLGRRKEMMEHERTRLNETYESNTLRLSELKTRASQMQHDKEEESNTTLDVMRVEHDASMKSLQNTLHELQRSLSIATEVHLQERGNMSRRIKELNAERERMKTQHDLDVSKKNQELKVETDYYNAEKQEMIELQQQLALYDRNQKEKEEEEMVIRKVIDMEKKADDIIFHSATALQKIYRGLRDRRIVSKMKKKKGKGKGKKGKAKTSKKKK